MGNDKQMQKAGDNSQQLIVESMSINSGITEQRAREIFTEMNAIARKGYTQEAYELAIKRVNMFEELLMNKVEKVDGMLASFGDPSFQFLLTEAQKRAAAADRDADIEMLTELLAHRVEKKSDRKTKASITKAVEIIDQIDDDALCALTLVHAINSWITTSGNITQGLDAMNNLFSSFCYMELPKGLEWAYHLDVLNVTRVSSIGTFKKFGEYYPEQLDGYSCVGIPQNSETYQNAINILAEANLPEGLLVEHELNAGYVRLSLTNRNSIKDISLPVFIEPNMLQFRKVSPKEIEVLNNIWDLYSNDAQLKENVKRAFMQKWDTYESLKSVRLWWEALPHSITITPTGKVLAHANAQRYNKQIPDINL
ncbi:MAG: hypothetical protein IJO74_03460 [Clostridia bacterium]|nr:hypothetical protein [Clostridia bacterium]